MNYFLENLLSLVYHPEVLSPSTATASAAPESNLKQGDHGDAWEIMVTHGLY